MSDNSAQPCKEFIKELQSYYEDPLRRFDGSRRWDRDPRPQICVFNYKNKGFTLMYSTQMLQHDDDDEPGQDYFTVISDPASDPTCDHVADTDKDNDCKEYLDYIDNIPTGRERVFSMRPINDETDPRSSSLTRCVFVALGWLVEHEPIGQQKTRKRTTYYVVLLNLSTQPTSVWLMGLLQPAIPDYVDGAITEAPFGLNCLDSSVTGATAAASNYQGCEIGDFRQIYTNMNEMRPKMDKQGDSNVCNARNGAHYSASGFSEDREFTSPNRNDGSESSIPPISSSAESSYEKSSDSSTTTIPGNAQRCSLEMGTSSVSEPESYTGGPQGYLDHPYPFDLAMLAKDINSWKTDGLDPEHVVRCLRSTQVCLGSSLRARTTTNAEKAQLKDKRISLEGLQL
ncbi:MAG: hypothetical protein Q9225_002941 [Loekoesia sp. 1 TL-2023]